MALSGFTMVILDCDGMQTGRLAYHDVCEADLAGIGLDRDAGGRR
jgi:hypothetical protein